ncbi:MAG: CoA-binding protein [Dehalococcoidia bacterium]
MALSEGDLLEKYHTIVVVGLTSDPSRPSNQVSSYMRSQGYRIIPVNPDEKEVFGEKAYPDLKSVPEPVEFVNVFRRSQFCPQVAEDAVAAGAKAIWLQSGIISAEARRIAEEGGLTYVENRCVKVEHSRNGIERV